MIRPLRVVLDTSAVLAYAHGSIHVGEIGAEVLAEGAEFGVPVVCLAAAAAETKDPTGWRFWFDGPAVSSSRTWPRTGDRWRWRCGWWAGST